MPVCRCVCASMCGYGGMHVCNIAEGSCVGGEMWSYMSVGETVKLFVGLRECVRDWCAQMCN